MFRRTSHCVCPPNSSFRAVIKSNNFQVNSSSDDFLMHSPPLPPRTIKNNFLSKYPIINNTNSEWNDKNNCYEKRVQCNCSRPHSCPAEESSFILTPPIPPKTCIGSNNSHGKSKNIKINIHEDQSRKTESQNNENRKTSRHRNSEKSGSRKKSRSNSRSLAREEKSKLTHIDKLPFLQDNFVDIHVNKYFLKNKDNLVDKNCHKSSIHKHNELCKICENSDNLMKYHKTHQTPPDLIISDRPSATTAGTTGTTGTIPTTQTSQNNKSCSNKLRSKWKAKITQLWSKSKKSSSTETSSPINNRDHVITTPENNPHVILKYTNNNDGDDDDDDTPRPRRSKSLHLIPDSSSLSQQKTSMQAKRNPLQTSTDANIITKNSSIFAVISPSTARWKRNLFCISPKAGGGGGSSNNNKNNNNSHSNNNKSEYNVVPVVGNQSSSSSCQQARNNPPSSISEGRISPVHLLAKPSNTIANNSCTNSSSNNNNATLVADSTRRDKDSLLTTIIAHNSGKSQKSSQNRQEKMDSFNSKSACASKPRTRIHQDNLNKSLQSSSLNQSLTVSNSPNPLCHCHNYKMNDTHFSCNNAYSRVCAHLPCIHNNTCQLYNIDANTNLDMAPGCSQVCGCVRNILHFSPNHFHCCHPPNGNTVLCSSCRIPIFCTSCSYNCYNSKPCHHSTSPPPCLSRQLPPPPPPPPAAAFSSGHHFPRKTRQSYSKTPPPSFHTNQHSCHDDHCYQEYNLHFNHENCQKVVANKSRVCNLNSKSGCYCQKFHSNHCYMAPHSKCSGCGSFIYEELNTLSTHYNMSGFHKNQFSNTPAADSLLEIKWRNTEQGLINQCRLFTPTANNEESVNRLCHNHCSNRPPGTCGHFSNEIKTPCCRNRDKLLKRRKSSSHSCHGSNLDPDVEEKCGPREISRTHFGSPNNLLPANSAHISPDLNPVISHVDLSTANNNSNNLTMTSSNITSIQLTNLVDSNDKFEPWRKTFKENMLALRNLGWYWGPLNHVEAENLVENRPDGTFLVRDSAHDTYFLSLTFRVLGTTYHTRIEYSQGKFSFWSQPESHSATTIVEFIDKAVAHSASGKFHYFLQTSTPGQPPMEVSLLYPLSRYQVVQSLQHLSRFVILSNIRKDHVSQLQLPSSLKGYLLEKQYYIDNIDAFVKLTKDAEPLIYEPSRNLYSTNNL